MSSIDPRGLLDEGGPLIPPGEALIDGAAPILVGVARGVTPLTLRSVPIAVENEARDVFEIIMKRRLAPGSLRNR